MYKSTYNFGLFLMASLILLSIIAAIPMSNMNLFSNVLASGKITDKNYNSLDSHSPAGITFLNSTNVYQVTNGSVIPNGLNGGAAAFCDEGDFLINGGYSIETPEQFASNINHLAFDPYDAQGSNFSNALHIFLAYSNATSTSANVTIIADCFDNPPLRP
ncbi:MAG TPA: hypothetical protein VF222_02425 [Nitrososphaeraceae archaeon]